MTIAYSQGRFIDLGSPFLGGVVIKFRSIGALLTSVATATILVIVPLSSQGNAAVTSIKIVSHNAEANSQAVQYAVSKAKSVGAKVILFQEICATDYQALQSANPNWSFSYRGDSAAAGCPSSNRESGNLAIVTSSGASASVFTFANQAYLPNRQRMSNLGGACLQYGSSPVKRACSVHLISIDQQVAAMQAQEIKQITAAWISSGDTVMVGGDFNASPEKPVLDYMYKNDRIGSRPVGRFYEFSRESDGTRCRCGASTVNSTPARQIDYIFVSDSAWGPTSPSSMARDSASPSDHKVLIGTGSFSY